MSREAEGPSSARAPRYPIQVPLRYRRSGESDWIEGTTENISRSGVLFRGDRDLAAGNHVEMTIRLPAVVYAGPGGEVLCSGAIVRCEPATATSGPLLLAARILDYRLVRQKGTPER